MSSTTSEPLAFTKDSASFREVLDRYQKEVAGFCLRFLGDPELASDATQEVFLTLWRERDRYIEEGRLRYYVLRIARLRCLAMAKRRRAQSTLPDSYLQQIADRGASPQSIADAKVLHQAIQRLKPKFAELVVLRHLQGLSLSETAEVTGLREGTIKSRLSRGMDALREELARGPR